MIKMASRITSATKSPMSRRMPDGMRIERWKRGPTTPARVHGGGSEGRGQSQQHARFLFSACPKPLGQQLSPFVLRLRAHVRCSLDSASYKKVFYDGKFYVYPGGSAFYHQSTVPSVISSISDKYKPGLHLFQNRSRISRKLWCRWWLHAARRFNYGWLFRITRPGRTVVSTRVLTPTEDGSPGRLCPAGSMIIRPRSAQENGPVWRPRATSYASRAAFRFPSDRMARL
jgi:hypothetical protein